ncbi:hypothetical protein IAI18_19175 [Acetobacteraceae bacterium H6797]|nr:hypothetical protein [Acetobacteraceae bacterium H6797]
MARAPEAALRRTIAGRLRLAQSDLDDARLLQTAGRLRNAAKLLESAIGSLIAAVEASEAASTKRAGIDRRNPLRPALMRLASFQAPAEISATGKLLDAPKAASLGTPMEQMDELLAELREHFGVEREGGEPARQIEPVRPVPEPPPAPPIPEAAPRKPKRKTRPPSTAAPLEVAPRSISGISSMTLWALADQWGLKDLEALALVGHKGGLTSKGTRPRFKLSDAQREIVASMASLRDTLEASGLDQRQWMARRIKEAPFGGARPVDLIRRQGPEALHELGRYLARMALKLSIKQRPG